MGCFPDGTGRVNIDAKDDSFLFPAHSVPAQQHGIRSASVFHCKNFLLLIDPGYRDQARSARMFAGRFGYMLSCGAGVIPIP